MAKFLTLVDKSVTNPRSIWEIFTPGNSRGFWECTKDVYTRFVGIEKAYDQVPRKKFWGV